MQCTDVHTLARVPWHLHVFALYFLRACAKVPVRIADERYVCLGERASV
jgi:hypothetical protein